MGRVGSSTVKSAGTRLCHDQKGQSSEGTRGDNTRIINADILRYTRPQLIALSLYCSVSFLQIHSQSPSCAQQDIEYVTRQEVIDEFTTTMVATTCRFLYNREIHGQQSQTVRNEGMNAKKPGEAPPTRPGNGNTFAVSILVQPHKDARILENQSRRLNSCCVMPRTRNPPLHLEEISMVFGDRATVPGRDLASGERSLPSSRTHMWAPAESPLEVDMVWHIEGKGRRGREAGKGGLRLWAELGLSFNDVQALGLSGDGLNAANGEVGDKVDTIEEWLVSMMRDFGLTSVVVAVVVDARESV